MAACARGFRSLPQSVCTVSVRDFVVDQSMSVCMIEPSDVLATWSTAGCVGGLLGYSVSHSRRGNACVHGDHRPTWT